MATDPVRLPVDGVDYRWRQGDTNGTPAKNRAWQEALAPGSTSDCIAGHFQTPIPDNYQYLNCASSPPFWRFDPYFEV